MKDRIQYLLEKQNLTPTRFADMVGLNRSAMSHIISGRNKPSLDVITKILQTFPMLNSDWLLFGKEPMYSHDSSQAASHTEFDTSTRPVSLFDQSSPVTETAPMKRNDTTPAPSLEKKIARIMIFYTDNTFETVIPDKSVSEF